MFACQNCGAKYSERYAGCSICFEQGCIIPLPQGQVTWDRAGRRGVIPAKQVRLENQPKSLLLDDFQVLFGYLPASSRWSLLIHGQPGSGKSTFALILANTLCSLNRIKVLYESGEEGQGETMSRKLMAWEIASDGLFISDASSLQEVENDLKDNQFSLCVLDSLTSMSLSVGDLGKITEIFGVSVIVITHDTKSGQYKGDSSLMHFVDVAIRMEHGIATSTKNRYGSVGGTFEIWGP